MAEQPPHRIFISYSHQDQALKDALCARIKEQVNFDAVFWDDSQLQTGSDWFGEIGKQIDEADAALLLASKHFFQSDFITKHELKPFWERWKTDRKAGMEISNPGAVKLIIVPIGADGSEQLTKSKLSEIQAAAKLSEPLPDDPDPSKWPDKALDTLVKEIYRSIDPTRVALEDKLASQPFAILKSLGRGSGTRLYLAETTMPPQRQVVVKAVEESSSRWEFYRSLRDAAEITDLANVVPLYTADLSSVPAHYVTRFVSGGSLRGYLERAGKLQWDRVQQVLLKIGKAVQSARQKGLLNRFYFDLRPSHILVEQWGPAIEPFLSFVGRDINQRGVSLVKQLGAPEEMTADQREAFAYLLPEQLGMTKESVVSAEVSDAYLLGLMGYQMLTGAVPKPPDTSNLTDDEDDVTRRFPDRVLFDKEHGGQWTEWSDWHFFAVVIERMISIAPRNRFPDCDAALWALEHPRFHTLRQVRESYKRCGPADEFFKSFYDNFFAAAPEARPLFSRLGKRDDSTNWQRQKKLVDSTVSLLFSYFADAAGSLASGEDQDSMSLAYFAARHKEVLDSKADKIGLTIDPAWFDQFVESLIDSACGPARPQDSDQCLIREQWRQVLRPGSDFLRKSHEPV